MGILDYVSDLYAALTVQEALAEEPQKDEGKNVPTTRWERGCLPSRTSKEHMINIAGALADP